MSITWTYCNSMNLALNISLVGTLVTSMLARLVWAEASEYVFSFLPILAQGIITSNPVYLATPWLPTLEKGRT